MQYHCTEAQSDRNPLRTLLYHISAANYEIFERERQLTPVRVRVSDFLEVLLSLLEDASEFTRVTDVAVALKLCADLDGTVTPDVAADAPVEAVAEVAPVQALHVRLVRGAECRGCGAGGRRHGWSGMWWLSRRKAEEEENGRRRRPSESASRDPPPLPAFRPFHHHPIILSIIIIISTLSNILWLGLSQYPIPAKHYLDHIPPQEKGGNHERQSWRSARDRRSLAGHQIRFRSVPLSPTCFQRVAQRWAHIFMTANETSLRNIHIAHTGGSSSSNSSSRAAGAGEAGALGGGGVRARHVPQEMVCFEAEKFARNSSTAWRLIARSRGLSRPPAQSES